MHAKTHTHFSIIPLNSRPPLHYYAHTTHIHLNLPRKQINVNWFKAFLREPTLKLIQMWLNFFLLLSLSLPVVVEFYGSYFYCYYLLCTKLYSRLQCMHCNCSNWTQITGSHIRFLFSCIIFWTHSQVIRYYNIKYNTKCIQNTLYTNMVCTPYFKLGWIFEENKNELSEMTVIM